MGRKGGRSVLSPSMEGGKTRAWPQRRGHYRRDGFGSAGFAGGEFKNVFIGSGRLRFVFRLWRKGGEEDLLVEV